MKFVEVLTEAKKQPSDIKKAKGKHFKVATVFVDTQKRRFFVTGFGSSYDTKQKKEFDAVTIKKDFSNALEAANYIREFITE